MNDFHAFSREKNIMNDFHAFSREKNPKKKCQPTDP